MSESSSPEAESVVSATLTLFSTVVSELSSPVWVVSESSSSESESVEVSEAEVSDESSPGTVVSESSASEAESEVSTSLTLFSVVVSEVFSEEV